MFLGCRNSNKNNDITTVNVDRKMTEYLNDIDIEIRNDRPQTAHMFNQLSLGFNTRDYIGFYGTVREYYILNNDKYSNVQISEWTEVDTSWVVITPGSEVRYEFYRDSDTYFTLNFGDGIDWGIINGLIAIKRIGPVTILARDNMVILEYENDLTGFKNGIIEGRAVTLGFDIPLNREVLYNSPENEIEHIYLTLFVKYMLRLINLEHWMSTVRYNETTYKIEPIIESLISNLKKYELSIIRNLLFARHNYAFRTEFWQDFMNTYYPKSYIVQEGQIWIPDRSKTEDWINFMDSYYHGDYVGLYTESEVISQFNWFERHLLEIIIEYENN
jgi:hypothetical protein